MDTDTRFLLCLLIACIAHALLFLPLNLPADRVVRLEITLVPLQSEIVVNETLSVEGVAEASIMMTEEVIKETQLEAIAEPESSVDQSAQLGYSAAQAVGSVSSASNQSHEAELTGLETKPEPSATYKEVSETIAQKEATHDKPFNADILSSADKLQDFAAFNIAQIAGLNAPSSASIWQRNLQPSKIRRLASGDAETIAEQYYLQSWRRKVQAIGKRNYPAEAKLFGLSGSLRLLVSIRHDGTLIDVRVLMGSGHDTLDDAAIKIINLASPFAPFPEQIHRYADILEIVHDWEFRRKNR